MEPWEHLCDVFERYGRYIQISDGEGWVSPIDLCRELRAAKEENERLKNMMVEDLEMESRP